MKFNIGDFVKVVEFDQVKYGKITSVAFDDWYEIDSDAGTYFHKSFIMPTSEYEMMNSIPCGYIYLHPVPEEDISAVNDSEMDQILAG